MGPPPSGQARPQRPPGGDRVSQTVPHNRAAERSVIGMALKSEDCALAGQDLPVDAFFDDRNRLVWQGVLDVLADRAPVTAVTVGAALARRRTLDAVGGHDALEDLADDVGTCIGFDHHVGILRDCALWRHLYAAGLDIANAALEADGTATLGAEKAMRRLADATKGMTRKDPKFLREIAPSVLAGIEARMRGEDKSGLATGILAVEDIVGELRAPDYVLVAADSGRGKTAFALQIASNVASAETPVIVFSAEMNEDDLYLRILARETRLNNSALRSKCLGELDYQRVRVAMDTLDAKWVVIDDTSAPTLAHVNATVQRFAARYKKPALVIVDYVQLMGTARDKGKNREQEVAELSKGLVALAKSMPCVVMGLSQLNKDQGQRRNGKPTQGSLRESAQLFNDAAIVLALYREDKPDEKLTDSGEIELIALKGRHSGRGEATMWFEGPTLTFSDRTERSRF